MRPKGEPPPFQPSSQRPRRSWRRTVARLGRSVGGLGRHVGVDQGQERDGHRRRLHPDGIWDAVVLEDSKLQRRGVDAVGLYCRGGAHR